MSHFSGLVVLTVNRELPIMMRNMLCQSKFSYLFITFLLFLVCFGRGRGRRMGKGVEKG